MANTYTQIHIQGVFAVKYRRCLIQDQWKDELYKYITGIVQRNGHKMLQINGMPDHIHLLFGMSPVQSLSDLIKFIKQDSSRWINDKGVADGKFNWQAGYGAFSYSKSQLPKVLSYIENQQKHHKKRSFLDEYKALLETHDIDYDDRYIFSAPE